MAVKETIAVIAAEQQNAGTLIRNLSGNRYRFLVVPKKQEVAEALSRLRDTMPGKEIEFLSCVKDGCWESDLVILDLECTQERKEASVLIQEVATQKVVISFEEEGDADSGMERLSKWLPHSKVVMVHKGKNRKHKTLCGNDEEALFVAEGFLKEAGFDVEILKSNK